MSDLYRTIFVDPWPWWAGGLAIGLLVPALYYFLNTALGVSTGYGNVVKMLAPRSSLRWLNSKTYVPVINWRVFFMSGMVLGAFLAARLSGHPLVTLDMGRLTAAHLPFWAIGLTLTSGGLLLGLGARIAGGCTSGHSIHGIANLHRSSILATTFFVLLGVLGAWLVRLVLFGGVR